MNDLPEIDPKAVRTALSWSQAQMAEFLDCQQSSVSRMEKKGRVSRLFRREYGVLEQAIASGDPEKFLQSEAA